MYWDPMWGILILADFRPLGISFHSVIVFGLGKNLLFKSVLGHCESPVSPEGVGKRAKFVSQRESSAPYVQNSRSLRSLLNHLFY